MILSTSKYDDGYDRILVLHPKHYLNIGVPLVVESNMTGTAFGIIFI